MSAEYSTHVDIPRKVQTKLILMYKSLPCLWDRSDFTYRDKKIRQEAMTKLTKLVQEHNPSVTRVHVLRKIESLRSSLRREMRKVQKSRQRVTNEEEVYQPRLWYFNMMSFVWKDEVMPPIKKQANESCSDSDTDDVVMGNSFEGSSDYNYTEPEFNSSNNIVLETVESTSSPSGATGGQKRYTYNEENSIRLRTGIDDEYDAIGINVAAKLRSLPTNMRILAEKLINDVLFEAQTNNLTSTTTITNPADPFK